MELDFKEYMIQGKALIGAGKFDAALDYFTKAEKEDPLNREVYLAKGVTYANMGNYPLAKTEFEKVLKLNRKDGLALFHLGNVEVLLHNRQRGLELFKQAIECGYEDAQVYYSLGLFYEDDEKYDLALLNYSKAIKTDENRPDVRVKKARLLLKMDKVNEALQTLDELILACPDIFEGYHFKFVTLESLKRYDEAEKVIRDALELFPKDYRFRLDLAAAHADKGKYKEALSQLELIRESVEENDLILHSVEMMRGRIYASLNDTKKVIAALEDAVDVYRNNNRTDEESLYLLLNCYLELKQYDKMLTVAKELKEVPDDNFYSLASYYYEALAVKNIGDDARGVELFEEAVAKYREKSLEEPGNIDIYSYRILCLREIGEYEKALELAEYMVNVAENRPESFALKAEILDRLGRKKEAEETRLIYEAKKNELEGRVL